MAVEDKYIDADIVAGERPVGALSRGQKPITKIATFEVAAADDNGSVYRIFKNVSAHLIPIDIRIYNDAITGMNDVDLGLYETDLGAVIDKDCFMDGGDVSSAHASGSGLSGLSIVDVANLLRALYEYTSEDVGSIKKAGYDIALTANTAGSAAGTITVVATFIEKF